MALERDLLIKGGILVLMYFLLIGACLLSIAMNISSNTLNSILRSSP